jgi:hypothetical protein
MQGAGFEVEGLSPPPRLLHPASFSNRRCVTQARLNIGLRATPDVRVYRLFRLYDCGEFHYPNFGLTA